MPSPRKRTIVPAAADAAEHDTTMSDYERERLENIKRNAEMLNSLGVERFIPGAILSPVKHSPTRSPRKRAQSFGAIEEAPKRASRRLRGESIADEAADGDEAKVEVTDDPDSYALGKAMTAEEFFPADVLEKAIRVDGHFRGWVKEEVRVRHGILGSAAEAWEANGGGKFSFKNPQGVAGSPSRRHSSGASSGWSEARHVASAMFLKNPNMYFYRHNEPGVEQWQGEWTEEETALFLDVARTYGAGDKWGLFASYIPHRVGYQCSNFYRQYILPKGLVIDPSYRLLRSGHVVYAGKPFSGRDNDDGAEQAPSQE